MLKNVNRLLMAVAAVSSLLMLSCSPKITAAEAEGVQYIYQVEKLARDVYKYLYEKWQTPVLDIISGSEQSHMDIMKVIINEYKLDDPAEGKGYGEFSNSDLQLLYGSLLESGSASEAKALSTAASIEEFDIVDIEKKVSNSDKGDIIAAYGKLTEGSENHLRIFVAKLTEKGLTYQPQYLSQQDYDQIIKAVTPTTATTVPSGATFGELAVEGKQSYSGNCFNCHADSLSTGPSSSVNLSKYQNAQNLLAKISAMPASGEQERWEVLAYLLVEHGWVSNSVVFNKDTLSQITLSQ